MLDVTRGKVPRLQELLQLTGKLAKLGYTHLELYIEHTFMFEGKECAWKDASPLSPADIAELDRFAAENGIELVPNCNTFGHMERFLACPEFRHLAECPEPFFQQETGLYRQGVLYPDEKSIDFVDSLFKSYLPCFSSRKVNIGCDETFELGHGRSQLRCETEGKHRVYLEHLKKLCQTASRYSDTILFWGDIILHCPELIGELPQNCIAMNWGYEAHHPFEGETAKFAAAGVPFAVCPGTSTWNSITGRTANMLTNLTSAVTHARKNGAVGLLLTDWGDGGHLQYAPLSYPAICTMAILTESGPDALSEEAVAAKVDEVFFDNKEHWGSLLLELGHLGDVFHYKHHNSTLFDIILFSESYPWANAVLQQIQPEEIQAAWQKLDDFKEKFRTFADNSITAREIANALRMTELSLLRMEKKKNLPLHKPYGYALACETIAEHCSLWLTRNRPGGMETGLARLEKVRKEFQ